MKIANILEEKERAGKLRVITASPDDTVLAAIRSLCENRIGALIVVDEEKQLCGILTEHDALHQCGCDPDNTTKVTVTAVMSRDVIVAHPQDKVEDALRTMTQKGIRHLPVVEEDRIVGILSIGDILRHLYTQDQLKIRHLSDYLGGTYGLKVY